MKILFIAPMPPPIDGQSKASKVLLDKLINEKHDIKIINLSKNSLKSGFNSIKRVIDIFSILFEVWKNRNNNDIIYLSLAESLFGNLRDLAIYTICSKGCDKIIVHMLGGAGMKKILEGKGLLQKINTFFLKRIGGIIVEGPANFDVFSKVVVNNRIHIVPNFAEDFLFVEDEEIEMKFQNMEIIQILYLSNLITGKGYDELADAYISLEAAHQKQVRIIYVGGFESPESENKFLSKIKPHNGLSYIGKFIDGDKKRELYCKSQVFCLPTYYPFEGQPISILEAYATGCVVVTSNHSGIPFIFTDQKNGFMVEKKSVFSLRKAIEGIINNRNSLQEIAFFNRNEALVKYRTSIYQGAIAKIFNSYLSK